MAGQVVSGDAFVFSFHVYLLDYYESNIIHGWIIAKDAKNQKFSKNYGDRPSAYFVTKEYLRSIKSLYKNVILKDFKSFNNGEERCSKCGGQGDILNSGRYEF